MCWIVFVDVVCCQVADERFLVLVNDLLASGDIADLFPDDEFENIINDRGRAGAKPAIYRMLCVAYVVSQVADERFLVLINDLLASGEIPDLFPDDEVENIINAMRPEVKGAGIYDSKENCWKFFINRVRRTLKVHRRQ